MLIKERLWFDVILKVLGVLLFLLPVSFAVALTGTQNDKEYSGPMLPPDGPYYSSKQLVYPKPTNNQKDDTVEQKSSSLKQVKPLVIEAYPPPVYPYPYQNRRDYYPMPYNNGYQQYPYGYPPQPNWQYWRQ